LEKLFSSLSKSTEIQEGKSNLKSLIFGNKKQKYNERGIVDTIVSYLKIEKCLKMIGMRGYWKWIRVLFLHLEQNKQLVGLDLRDMSLGDLGIVLVSRMLRYNQTIKVIDIDKNSFTLNGLMALRDTLRRKNKTLCYLHPLEHDLKKIESRHSSVETTTKLFETMFELKYLLMQNAQRNEVNVNDFKRVEHDDCSGIPIMITEPLAQVPEHLCQLEKPTNELIESDPFAEKHSSIVSNNTSTEPVVMRRMSFRPTEEMKQQLEKERSSFSQNTTPTRYDNEVKPRTTRSRSNPISNSRNTLNIPDYLLSPREFPNPNEISEISNYSPSAPSVQQLNAPPPPNDKNNAIPPLPPKAHQLPPPNNNNAPPPPNNNNAPPPPPNNNNALPPPNNNGNAPPPPPPTDAQLPPPLPPKDNDN